MSMELTLVINCYRLWFVYPRYVLFYAVRIFGAKRKKSVCSSALQKHTREALHGRNLDCYNRYELKRARIPLHRISTDLNFSAVLCAYLIHGNTLLKAELFWGMTPCWLVNSYRRFGGPCRVLKIAKYIILITRICRQQAVFNHR